MIIAGKYEVIGELGKGGMGVVYQVRHLELGSIFALKVLRSDLTDETVEAVARFYNEARVMARLRHPHIIQVFDIGQDEGRHYFVMEYIRGRNLHDILKQEGALPLSKALTIGAQVGQALAYAHTQQPPVVHRDIKPHNIMLEDGTNRVIVMDFGIAKLLDPQRTQYTHTGVFLGTLAYSAPEQLRSTMTIDGRADIFSLGLVLYEMTTGHKFFLGLTREEIIGKQLFEPGVYLPAFERPMPRAFRRLVAKAIMKDRDRRYNTVTELLAALAKVPVARRNSKRLWTFLIGGVSLTALAVMGWTWNGPWLPHGERMAWIERLIAEPTPPSKPSKPEPPKIEPIKPEPVKPQPIKLEPAKPEPIKPEPIKPEPVKPEPVKHLDKNSSLVEENPIPPATSPPPHLSQGGENRLTPAPATVLSTEARATAPPVELTPSLPVHPPVSTPSLPARPPVAIVETPKPAAPPAPPLQVTPPAGRITLKACETQTFAVNDNPPRRYVWWIDAQRHLVDRCSTPGGTGAAFTLLRATAQVRIQDWQAEALNHEVKLSFEQADRWRDATTRSIMMDYSSQNMTLIRQDCARIVAR
jgi:serine/threonine-protein kinase